MTVDVLKSVRRSTVAAHGLVKKSTRDRSRLVRFHELVVVIGCHNAAPDARAIAGGC